MTQKNLTQRLLLFLFAVSLPVWCQSLGPPKDIQGFDKFMTYYYQNPHPEFILETIKCLNLNKWPNQKEQFPPTVGFYAEVFALNPMMVQLWTDEIQFCEGNTKEVLQLSLKTSLKMDKMISGGLSDFDPGSNDFCWGAFFASGDTAFLAAIVERLAFLSDKFSLYRFLTAASAQWSLSSNAALHPLVKQYLQTKAKTSAPDIAQAVNDSLELDPGQITARTLAFLKNQHEKGVW